MINVGEYVKILLKKRNMTQMDLLRKMNELKLGKDGKELNKQHLNNFINGTSDVTSIWAKRIEIALDLPKDSLVNMICDKRGKM